MKSAFCKDTFREIWKTKNRFLSIFAIIAIGVGFFAGVKATCSDMEQSEDYFYKQNNLMDVRVVSTLGFGEKDLEAFRTLDGIKGVMPSYSADLFMKKSGNTAVCKVYSLPQTDAQESDRLNELRLAGGRMPEQKNECVIDAYMAERGSFSIGDTVQMKADGDASISSTLSQEEFTIVGTVESPMYIYKMQRGSSTIGDGTADGYVYLLPEAFSYEDYTDVYLTFESSEQAQAYTEEYDSLSDGYIETVERLGDTRKGERLTEVKAKAGETITENEQKLADAKVDAEQQIADAEQQLADAKQQLDSGEAEYLEKKQEFDARISEAEQTLTDSKTKTKQGWEEYDAGLKRVSDGLAALQTQRQMLIENRSKLDAAKEQIVGGEEQLTQAEQALADKQKEYEQGLAAYQSAVTLLRSVQAALSDPSSFSAQQLAAIQTGLNQMQSGFGDLFLACVSGNATLRPQLDAALTKASQTLAAQKGELEKAPEELEKAKQELAAQREIFEQKRTEYQQGKQAYQSGMEQIDAVQKELDDSAVALLSVRNQLVQADKEISQGEQELASRKAEGERQLNDAKQTLDDGKTEYENGVAELEEKKLEAQQEITDAEQQLADAKQKLEELEEPAWYVLDRDSACSGYTNLGDDAMRVDNVAKVFPVFFLLVAALVCLTTMTRMIEEERTEIGTLKALGYSNGSIIMKYMTYGTMASLFGSVIGLLIGFQAFPRIIMNAYKIMYDIPHILTPLRVGLAAVSILAAALCVGITVYAVCRGELLQRPSQLMRPKSPKPGKRVLLERIPFLWNRFNFSHKVTARNLFRYKQRIIMTVVGIAGCTALILTGFGLKDSIMEIVDKQFTEISLYDMMIAAKDGEIEKTMDTVGKQPSIGLHGEFLQETMTAVSGSKRMEVNLSVPQDTDTFPQFINMHTRKGKEPVSLQDGCVVLTEKLAVKLGLSVGDTFRLQASDYSAVELKVGGIIENYTYHYVYMTPQTFRDLYGREPDYNLVFARWNDPQAPDAEGVFTALSEQDAMQGMTFLGNIKDNFSDMVSSLNYVILVLIVSAGLLAFVVLYNLTNINVNERIREIATLKVLGFYDKEVSAYIYRENVILTLLGTGAGLILGIFFTRFVISTAEMDIVMFGREIKAMSYLFAAALTLAFAVLVNFVMHFKLKKVKMVESLKSVE